MRVMFSFLALLALPLPARAPADETDGPAGSGLMLAQDWRPHGAARPSAPPAAQPAAPSSAAPMRPTAPAASPQPALRGAPAQPGSTAPGVRHPTMPAPPPRPPGYYYGPGYYPYYPYYVSPWSYSVYLDAPWWWGWGWGYGWYPVYPAPPPPAPGETPPVNRISTEIAITGGSTDQNIYRTSTLPPASGATVGFSVRVEGRELGVHASYDGVFTNRNMSYSSSTVLDYFTAHLTLSFLSGRSGRLRIEGGLAVLDWPGLPVYAPFTTVGPEVGLSGQVSLLGPLGLVGHARVSPSPRMTTDLQLAAALRFGPVALSGGWRDLRADGGATAPDVRFAGPQFGLALLF